MQGISVSLPVAVNQRTQAKSLETARHAIMQRQFGLEICHD